MSWTLFNVKVFTIYVKLNMHALELTSKHHFVVGARSAIFAIAVASETFCSMNLKFPVVRSHSTRSCPCVLLYMANIVFPTWTYPILLFVFSVRCFHHSSSFFLSHIHLLTNRFLVNDNLISLFSHFRGFPLCKWASVIKTCAFTPQALSSTCRQFPCMHAVGKLGFKNEFESAKPFVQPYSKFPQFSGIRQSQSKKVWIHAQTMVARGRFELPSAGPKPTMLVHYNRRNILSLPGWTGFPGLRSHFI